MKIDRDVFLREGFVVAKNMFSPEEVEHYRGLLVKHSKLNDESYHENKKWSEADGVTKHSDFWPLIYNEKLLDILRQLVPTAPRYLQYSDLHVHYDSVGWHRDIRCDSYAVEDGDEKIGALRVAMYFQSYEESNFKMGIIPRTHLSLSSLSNLELKTWSLYRKFTRKLPFWYFTLQPRWVKIDPGDCLVFDTRLLHTGSATTGPKYSIYLGYGEDQNSLSERQVEYLHERKDLHYTECPLELADVLKEKDLISQYVLDRMPEAYTESV